MTQDEIIQQLSDEADVATAHVHWSHNATDSERRKFWRNTFAALVAAHERRKQAEQEPVAWMWACTECGTEAEDGTDGRICSSCGYHKFYKAPKVATCVCAAKTQEKVKQEPVAWGVQSTDDFLIFQNESQAHHYATEWEFVVAPLYTAPQPVKLAISEEVFNWIDANAPLFVRDAVQPVKEVELTDDEIEEVFDSVGSWKETLFGDLPVTFARAVIAADREKNK